MSNSVPGTLIVVGAEMPQRREGMVATSEDWSLIDWYLEQQSQLSAVDQFSRVHDQLAAPVYKALLPTKAPEQGEQYAFEVDLDLCSGCKACVTACHSLNGLDDQETWREVGLLTGGTEQQPFLQHVTTACHHCLEPACMDVCPTLAYEKDSSTGIVKHLDDQCFGCQYCILACPYNVPKYNSRLGVVRKCDLCSQRLKTGEAPACVQACPHQAIRIQTVSIDQVKSDCETSQFLPGTPDPQYTLPTTNYKSRRSLPRNLIPADYFRVQTEHAHSPLVTMLVLTQLSVGGYCLAAIAEERFGKALPEAFGKIQSTISLGFCFLALGASVLHLGRPWLAYRAMLGLRRSWLSREILTFGIFAGSASWLTGLETFPKIVATFGLHQGLIESAVLLSGVGGVFCSAMIYHRTKRPFWNISQAGGRFGLTTLLLGLGATWVSLTVSEQFFVVTNSVRIISADMKWGIAGTAILKGLLELGALVPLADRPQTVLKRSALLLTGPLRPMLVLRFTLLTLAGLVFTGASLAEGPNRATASQELGCAVVSLAGLIWGEMLERSLFFKASVAFRMPGGPCT